MMNWGTAIALVLRFYGGAIQWSDIWNMTPRQIVGLIEEAGAVMAMETGKTEPKPLEGKAAAAALRAMFGDKVKAKEKHNAEIR